MSEMIVACAGCGKRFKGSPSPKKFKCSGCHNLFTFPDAPRAAAEGKLLCTCCWGEVEKGAEPMDCPTCGQKLTPAHSGRAAPAASSSNLQPTVIVPQDAPHLAKIEELDKKLAALDAQLADLQKDKRDLEAKAAELITMLANAQTTVATMRLDRDRAIRELDGAKSQAARAQAELDRFRQTAVSALEPIGKDYKVAMKTLSVEAEVLLSQARDLQDSTQQRMEALKDLGAKLDAHIREVRRRFAEQLSAVIGTDADLTPAPVPREKAVPAALAAGGAAAAGV